MTDEVQKTKAKSASAQLRLDRESQMVLHQGASIGQLSLLFARDKRTIASKIAGHVEPCGMRAGFPIYQVKDVAPFLVPPQGDFEEAIKKMHHEEIPPLLHKNYWAGKRERQKFEEEEGRLIDVHIAAEEVAKAFKSARMSILLMPDALEREFVLTDEHRTALKRAVDGTLKELRTKMIEAFQTPEEPDYGPSDAHPDAEGDIFDEVSPDGEAGEPAELEDEFQGL